MARHGLLLDGPIAPMASTGVVHVLWSLGSRFVLRVPKNETMCLGDLHAEVAAIPVAMAAGISTPRLICFDESLSIVEVPYTIVERVHGSDLATLAPEDPRSEPLLRTLGQELARLHPSSAS